MTPEAHEALVHKLLDNHKDKFTSGRLDIAKGQATYNTRTDGQGSETSHVDRLIKQFGDTPAARRHTRQVEAAKKVKPTSAIRALSDTQVKDLRGGSAESHLVTDASGTHFTPERQALHDKIINDIVVGHKAQKNPAFVMLGGGPASGKTKAAEAAEKEFPDAIKIDPDEIKKSLPEYHTQGPETAAAHVHEESSYLAKRVQAEALKSKSHVVLDAVGDSSVTNVKSKIDQAHAAGYTAHARYVTVPTSVAQERAHARGVKSGRVVPPEVIKHLHSGVSRVFPKIVDHFDTASLHDNSGTEFKQVLSKSHGGGTVIHDAPAYHDFLNKGIDEDNG